jgi:N-methylhydantoinase A/oxoprolinase/acetone carboxylase beta subunit
MPTTTIDIDTGGTFTDVFVVRDGTVITAKVLTTPHDLALCFQQVVEKAAGIAGLEPRQLLREATTVRYATTVGTNSVIQRRGPRLGLITAPKGTDLYAHNGDSAPVFDLFLSKDMVATVPDRVADPSSAPTTEISPVSVAAKQLLSSSARGLVCSMPGGHDVDERAVRTTFEQHYPKNCLDSVPLLLSHEIATDPDDFRRTTTALFNAYVHPDVATYLYRAEDYLRSQGYRWPLLIVHNDGGCARVAKTIAGKTYNSGPMAGLMGARAIAKLYGIDDLVTFDMGGTSLDVAIIRGGELPMDEHGLVEGAAISFPLADVMTIGAGGGSIAHTENGELRVGPQSAGARPGPACFGFGGTSPTTTDANVVLGFVDGEKFLGGAMTLDSAKAVAVYENLGAELGTDAVTAAANVRSRLHQDMADRISAVMQARSVTAESSVILAYGGAGPTDACEVAELLGVSRVISVPFASVFSAFGASTADHTHAYQAPEIGDVEDELITRALRDMRGEGFGPDAVELTTDSVVRHGVRSVQVQATARLGHHQFQEQAPGAAAQPSGQRQVTWPGHGALATATYEFADLRPGASITGPAILHAADTTYAIPSGWTFTVDAYGNGICDRDNSQKGAER